MTEGFFIEQQGPEIIAFFANGGVLQPIGDVWVYERDGKYSMALEPEFAVMGTEGPGKVIWSSRLAEQTEGGE